MRLLSRLPIGVLGNEVTKLSTNNQHLSRKQQRQRPKRTEAHGCSITNEMSYDSHLALHLSGSGYMASSETYAEEVEAGGLNDAGQLP